jgi:hypothetical protein
MSKNSLVLFFLIPALLLLITAFIKIPYGFYKLTKLIVIVCSALIIYDNYKNTKVITPTIIIFSLILIIFNPLFPIRFNGKSRLVINLFTSGVFVYSYYKNKKRLEFENK